MYILFCNLLIFKEKTEADTNTNKRKKICEMRIQFYTDKRHLIYQNKHFAALH
jgi:hypothetical protein